MTRHATRTLFVGLLAALAFALAPLPAAAQELQLDAGGNFQVVRDDSYFGLSTDDQAGYANLGLGVTVWDHLSLVAEYHTGAEVNTLFSFYDMNFTVHAARLSLKYAYPLTSWLHPYALVGLGAYWGDLDLEGGGRTYDDTAFGIGAFAAGGFEAIWYFGDPQGGGKVTFWDHLGIGIFNDYGYSFGPNLTLDEVVAENGGGGSVDLGEVDLSGFTWRLGFTVRYRF